MEVSELLRPENVVVGLQAPKKQLLKILSEKAAAATGVDSDLILQKLQARERLGSTGIGGGVAIPHAAVAQLDQPFALLARLAAPIDFDAIDEVPVDLVFLLLNPESQSAGHLSNLACVARALRRADAITRVREAEDSQDVFAALTCS